VFISDEVESFSGEYLNNPFGSKKDKRIENWLSILNKLPLIKEVNVNLQNQVSADFHCEDMQEIEELLLQLLPWRKGPFKLSDINIDSEWDSSKKWKRFKELELDVKNKTILDVGSGNGYYAFRMIGDGADQVLCLEPNLVHVSQFASINHFVGSKKIRMIPERLENSGLRNTNFDLIFSMGLLYHQRNPLEHLNELNCLLAVGGKIVIETIISPDQFGSSIQPTEGHYATMPNVHYVHTDFGCKEMFEKLNLRVIGETKPVFTNIEEQRKTRWMPFKSFESVLDANDARLTIEGYPAPARKFYLLGQKS
tara:strand:+ start:121 stop:1050 length:930 start_codon:yes stop_codon:yes gene_type:complete